MAKIRVIATRGTDIATLLAAQSQKSYEPSQYFDERPYITPFGSYIFSDSGQELERRGGRRPAVSLALQDVYWTKVQYTMGAARASVP